MPLPPSGVSASRGHRSLSPRVAPATLRTPVTVCPHAPRLRSPRLPLASSLCRRRPLLPPAGWAAVLCAVASPSPPAGWAGALGAAERAGRWYPRFGAARHPCHASAGRGSAPRRPGERRVPTPFGRAAEPARSAVRASSGHPPPHSAPALYPRAPLLPVLTRGAASYPPGLAALCRVPAVLRGLRFAWSPLRYRSAIAPLSLRVAHVSLRTPVTICPHAPRLRSPRLPLASSLCRRCPLSSYRMGCRPLCRRCPLSLLPDGVASSEPRSVRADVIPGSERSAAPATRQRGGGARRVDRGRGARPPVRPSRGACEISRPRQLRPPTAT